MSPTATIPVPPEVAARWAGDAEFRWLVTEEVLRRYDARVAHLVLVEEAERSEFVDEEATQAYCVESVHEVRAEKWLEGLASDPLPTIEIKLTTEAARMAASDPIFRRTCANTATWLEKRSPGLA